MTTIRATFIGEDGSFGYQKGRRYLLIVEGRSVRPMLSKGGSPSPQPCPYSVEGFFNNWREIEVIDGPTYMD